MIEKIGGLLSTLLKNAFKNIESINNSIDRGDDINRILPLINKTKSDIAFLKKFIERISTLVNSLNKIVTVFSFLPLPTAPFPITVGLIMKLSSKLIELKKIIDSISQLLKTSTNLLNNIEVDISEIESKSSSMIVNSEENIKSVNLDNKFAVIKGMVYGGYKFDIIEDVSKVEGAKKRYAVAYDSEMVVKYRTQSSYTLNPDVLIEELRLKIDENK